MKIRTPHALAAVAVSFLMAAPALAGEPTDVVKDRTARVTATMAKKATKKREVELEKLLRESVDFRELASRSLKGYWEKKEPAQQEEFLKLLQELLQANYSAKLSGKRLGTDYTIAYLDEKTRGDVAFVRTEVKSTGGERPVTYRLYKNEKGDWSVYDIVTDDISLEETYREGYTKIIREEGWDTLIERMKEKAKELRAAAKK